MPHPDQEELDALRQLEKSVRAVRKLAACVQRGEVPNDWVTGPSLIAAQDEYLLALDNIRARRARLS